LNIAISDRSEKGEFPELAARPKTAKWRKELPEQVFGMHLAEFAKVRIFSQ